MLHKCANPACSNPFRRLSEGKLFQVETEYLAQSSKQRREFRRPPRVEHYWLCTECSSFLTLTFERGMGMITVPLPNLGVRKTVAAVEQADLHPGQEGLLVAGARVRR